MKSTHLIIEGVSPEEITSDFFVAIDEVSEDYDLDVGEISIQRD